MTERTPKSVIAATLNAVLTTDRYDEDDAWSIAGLILDDLTDDDVRELAMLREVLPRP